MRYSTNKKVCHVSTVHPRNDVRIFYRECLSLKKAGYEVNLVINDSHDHDVDGINVLAIPKPNSRLIRMLFMPFWAFCRALKTGVHTIHYHDPEFIFMGFILRWIFGKKVVFDIHESVCKQIMSKKWLPRFLKKFFSVSYKIIEKFFTKGQILVLANDNSVKDYNRNAYLVRNFPELTYSDTKSEPKKEAKDVLVYLGGVSKIRGGDVYLELANRLKESGRDFEMYIIGQYDKEYGKELFQKIDKYDLHEDVKLTGRMPYDKALQIVQKSDLGLCLLLPVPNYTTCLATKILEYMMFKVPVLASNFTVWLPYVLKVKSGCVADPENSDEIFDVCTKMLNDREMLCQMGDNGRRAVENEYNWSNEFANLLQIYENN